MTTQGLFFKLTQWGVFLMAAAGEKEKEDGVEVDEVRRFISSSEVDSVFSHEGEEENDGTQCQPLRYQSKLNNN